MSELRWILLGIGLVLLALIYFFSRRSGQNDDVLPPSEPRFEPSLSQTPDTRDSAMPDFSQELPEPDPADTYTVPASDRFDRTPDEPIRDEPSTPELGPIDDGRIDDGRIDHGHATSSDSRSVASEPPLNDASVPVVPEKVIALHLMPKAGSVFGGLEFIGAVQAEGLKFGRFEIFHRFLDPETATDASPSQFSLANMIKPGTFNLRDIDRQEFKGASLFLVLPGPDDAVAAFSDMVATGRRLAATLDGQLLDAQGTQLSRQSASHLREDIINYQHGLSAAPAD